MRWKSWSGLGAGRVAGPSGGPPSPLACLAPFLTSPFSFFLKWSLLFWRLPMFDLPLYQFPVPSLMLMLIIVWKLSFLQKLKAGSTLFLNCHNIDKGQQGDAIVAGVAKFVSIYFTRVAMASSLVVCLLIAHPNKHIHSAHNSHLDT